MNIFYEMCDVCHKNNAIQRCVLCGKLLCLTCDAAQGDEVPVCKTCLKQTNKEKDT